MDRTIGLGLAIAALAILTAIVLSTPIESVYGTSVITTDNKS